jgi:predicted Zn-dependent protease
MAFPRTVVVAGALAVLVGSCATNPVTGKREFTLVSEGQEVEMGKGAAEEVAQTIGLYDNAATQSYVERLGKSLAAQSERPELPWTFRVVDDPVVNAFALPGGFIFITRGLMAHPRLATCRAWGTTLTRGQYAPLLHRSSAAPHSALPQPRHPEFLRRD